MAQIEAQLDGLPDPLQGALVCDWSRAEAPGIGPVWALLMRLDGTRQPALGRAARGQSARTLCRCCRSSRRIGTRRGPPPTSPACSARSGNLGRWAVLQGTRGACRARLLRPHRQRSSAQALSRPRALRLSSLARHIYETGITAIPIVSLIAFLISVIVAYLGAQQLTDSAPTFSSSIS